MLILLCSDEQAFRELSCDGDTWLLKNRHLLKLAGQRARELHSLSAVTAEKVDQGRSGDVKDGGRFHLLIWGSCALRHNKLEL